MAAIQDASKKIAVLQAANTSLGINVLLGLVKKAAGQLAHFDVEISEIHHRIKRDAPSGTALVLADAVRGARPELQNVLSRTGSEARQPAELGITALRGGTVPGEHTVFYFGENERLELTHRSTSPSIFASGALHGAKWLSGKPSGLYSMAEVLDIEQ
jgi:4-hydroxy-tetrahydrodipicolinate reductase